MGLAQDVLDHDCCDGCKYNAAQALDALGRLSEVLTLIDKPDPRLPWASVDPQPAGAAYRSTLSIRLGDGTVVRDADAHEWIQNNRPTTD